MNKIKKICKHPACSSIAIDNGYCELHQSYRKQNNRNKDKSYSCRSYQHLYNTRRWKKRRELQLKIQPLCEECIVNSLTTLAGVADHIEDHKGDINLFYNGKLQSLCWSCHSKKTNKDNQLNIK
jgi:hypothetical protein